jgi:hypothetical protein
MEILQVEVALFHEEIRAEGHTRQGYQALFTAVLRRLLRTYINNGGRAKVNTEG